MVKEEEKPIIDQDQEWWNRELEAVWQREGLSNPLIYELALAIGLDCMIFEETEEDLVDLNGSCVSSIDGPIPVPEAFEWPDCPNCDIPFFVNPSFDFRGLPFMHLLPGRTLSCFLCPDCIRYGNGEEH